MNTTPTPRRIEWSGPESWTVWADEDGVHVRSAHGDCLEMPDVERLFSLWTAARAMTEANHVESPKPPTREEMSRAAAHRNEEYIRRRAVRAIESEFNADQTAPF